MSALADFHFIRPLWLLALIPLALLWLLLRRRTDPAQPWRNIIAPHLLPHLLSIPQTARSTLPLNLLALGWLLAVIAIAGPAWRREPAPFAYDTAALIIVMRVSDSMLTEDVQPGRLARSVEKIHDLLALRTGAKAALIAYAGTAHIVMPATTDAAIIDTFAQALSPKIMPRPDGDAAPAALRLAAQTLNETGGGSILWITDALSPDASAQLANWRKTTRAPVYLYPPLLPGEELDTLATAARPAGARLITLTPDEADMQSLARTAKYTTTASDPDSTARWAETGYWLTPLLALLLLPFFRRGWMLATAARS